MSDPREAFEAGGIRYGAVTYDHDDTIVYDATKEGGSSQVGLAVTLESAHTVSLIGDGEELEGKLIKVEPGGKAVVQNKGYMELPGGTTATLTTGTKVVGDLLGSAEGYIQSASSQHTVSRGRIVDPTTTTAVVIELP
jgi:hypothetical protein